MPEQKRHFVDFGKLPSQFPTNGHEPAFWEGLGRAVATFGFLEEVLAKAIFAFTATTPYSEEEAQKALDNWLPQLQGALCDQLWSLIKSYEKVVREHPDATIENFEELVGQLKEASKVRNVICHGSWRHPNFNGASIPFFMNRQQELFDTPVDVSYLLHLQKHVSELICAVADTVTLMGWQFPGSEGPGKVIWGPPK